MLTHFPNGYTCRQNIAWTLQIPRRRCLHIHLFCLVYGLSRRAHFRLAFLENNLFGRFNFPGHAILVALTATLVGRIAFARMILLSVLMPMSFLVAILVVVTAGYRFGNKLWNQGRTHV